MAPSDNFPTEATTVFTQPNESSLSRALKDFTAGWMGGIAQVLVGQPFDTLKVRLQTQPVYKGVIDCAAKTMTGEGIRGFYRGTMMPLFGIGFCVSIQFGALEGIKRFLTNSNGNIYEIKTDGRKELSSTLTPAEFFIAGSAAGLANTVISAPVEHIRIRCQASGTCLGPLDCLRTIYNTAGLKGIYKGWPITLVRDGIGFGAYFMTYEALIQQTVARARNLEASSFGSTLSNKADLPHFTRENIPAWHLVGFGALAGLAFWVPVFPVDVIKSKLQNDKLILAERTYKNSIDCAAKIWRAQGLSGFYKGFWPCFWRAAPVNAATFLAFEITIRALE